MHLARTSLPAIPTTIPLSLEWEYMWRGDGKRNMRRSGDGREEGMVNLLILFLLMLITLALWKGGLMERWFLASTLPTGETFGPDA